MRKTIAFYFLLLFAEASNGGCFEIKCNIERWGTEILFKNHDDEENMCRAIPNKQGFIR